jgi:hypothetical protein
MDEVPDMNPRRDIKPLMTRKEYADLVGIAPMTVTRMIADGAIRMVGSKIPAREYYKLFQIDDLKTGDNLFPLPDTPQD